MNHPKTSIAPDALLGGKYRVGEVLGSGGMGCVYKAVNEEIGLKVAVKHLHLEFSTEPEVVRRFRQEAKLAASIGHDNICEVIDFGVAENGSPFLVMPRLKGYSLGDLITRMGVLPPPQIVDIACQTLAALEAAHRAHIVHRDLKPDNIFITKVGDREDFVKLLDFGISKIMDQDSVSNMTCTGAIMGTPYYMAPEQAQGLKTLDHRTDIWAMGVILFEALTGRRPFEGDSYNEIMFKICGAPFPAPSEINAAVPMPLEEVVLRAMSRDPGGRFQSADEMRQSLDAAWRRFSEAASQPRVSTAMAFAQTVASIYPVPMARKARHSKRALMVATAIVALVAVVAFAGWRLVSQEPTSLPVAVPLRVPHETAVAPVPAPVMRTPPAAETVSLSLLPDKPKPAEPLAATVPDRAAVNKTKIAHDKAPKATRGDQGSIKGRFNTEVDKSYE